MRADVLILGQGLAGTLLGWELERAGLSFVIADPGHAAAATSAAAGIINPITGRRLVKSWRVDELLPAARATYAEIERAWDVPLWQEMRIRRLFTDERERAAFAHKRSTGELAPFADAGNADGLWIDGAARVDLQRLIGAARTCWLRAGKLREIAVAWERELDRHAVVIDCTGLAGAQRGAFSFVPWEFSKGEVLEINATDLDPHVIINMRHWLLPVGEGTAWVGATHEPGNTKATASAAARGALQASAAKLLGGGRPFRVTGQRAGIRVNLPDKRPVAGRHPEHPRLGLINGLGAKGALWAPLLARDWVSHLTSGGGPFEAELDVRRFVK